MAGDHVTQDDAIKNRRRSLSRLAPAALVTITLGAVGSGVWELFLSRIVTGFFRGLLTLLGRFFRGYLDHLYSEVGGGTEDAFAFLPFMYIVSISIVISWACLYLIFRIRRMRQSDGSTDQSRHSKRKIGLAVTMVIFNTISYGAFAFEIMYTRAAGLFIEHSIDVLAPKISEQERLELTAAYRSVENADSYLQLYDLIRKRAVETRVDLRDFSPIR